MRTTPPPHGYPTGTPNPSHPKASEHHTPPHQGLCNLRPVPHPTPPLINHQSSVAYSHSQGLSVALRLQTQTPLVSREAEGEADKRECVCSASRGIHIFKKLKTLLTTHSVVILPLHFAIPDVLGYLLQPSPRYPQFFLLLSITPVTESSLGQTLLF